MEFKFLIMMTSLQNIVLCLSMFCGLVIFIKNLNSITAGLGCPFWFHIFFSLAFFGSWPLLFYTQCILVRISLFWKFKWVLVHCMDECSIRIYWIFSAKSITHISPIFRLNLMVMYLIIRAICDINLKEIG